MNAEREMAELGRHVEKAVLGALFTEPGRIGKVAAVLAREDFDEPRHQIIWDAMIAVHQNGHAPDHVLVLGELRRTGMMAKVAAVLPELPGACPNPSLAAVYAQQVHETAERRRILHGLRSAAGRLEEASPDAWLSTLADVIDALDDVLQSAAKAGQ